MRLQNLNFQPPSSIWNLPRRLNFLVIEATYLQSIQTCFPLLLMRRIRTQKVDVQSTNDDLSHDNFGLTFLAFQSTMPRVGNTLSPAPGQECRLWLRNGKQSLGRFQRPSERVPFSDEGGFVFSKASFKGTLHEGLKGASPSERFKGASKDWRGLEGASRGLKGAWPLLEGGLTFEGGLNSTLKGASRAPP